MHDWLVSDAPKQCELLYSTLNRFTPSASASNECKSRHRSRANSFRFLLLRSSHPRQAAPHACRPDPRILCRPRASDRTAFPNLSSHLASSSPSAPRSPRFEPFFPNYKPPTRHRNNRPSREGIRTTRFITTRAPRDECRDTAVAHLPALDNFGARIYGRAPNPPSLPRARIALLFVTTQG